MKYLASILLLMLPFIMHAQEGFKVTMHIKGLGDHNVKVIFQKNGRSDVDTLVKQGEDLVVWEGKTVDPQFVRVEVMDTSLYLRVGKAIMPAPALAFLLANTDITINGDAKQIFTATVESKHPEVVLYNNLRVADLPNAIETWTLQKEQNKKRNNNDTIGNYDISQKLTILKKKNQAMRIQFLNDNPTSYTSLLVLQSLFLILPVNESEKRFNALKTEHKNSVTGQAHNLKIESNKKTAVGKPVIPFAQEGMDGSIVDIAAFKGRVNFSYDYYDKTTKGMLYQVNIPWTTGYSSIQDNIGEFHMWGHEFNLNTVNLEGSFRWSSNFNLSINRNMVIKLGVNDQPIGAQDGWISQVNRTAVGYPIGQFYVFLNDGVYMTQAEFDKGAKAEDSQVGTQRFKDLNSK